MLLMTKALLWLFVGLVAASVFLGLSIARRLGLPVPAVWTWRIETRHWPRLWAFMLCFLLVVKALVGGGRMYQGLAFWPEWKWEAPLFIALSGLLTLFNLSCYLFRAS